MIYYIQCQLQNNLALGYDLIHYCFNCLHFFYFVTREGAFLLFFASNVESFLFPPSLATQIAN